MKEGQTDRSSSRYEPFLVTKDRLLCSPPLAGKGGLQGALRASPIKEGFAVRKPHVKHLGPRKSSSSAESNAKKNLLQAVRNATQGGAEGKQKGGKG